MISIQETVLLAMARIKSISNSDRKVSICAFLDSTSEASFITKQVAQQLLLRRHKADVTVSGLQGINTSSHEDFCPDGDNSQRSFLDSRRVDAIGII